MQTIYVFPSSCTARLAAQRYSLTYQEPIPVEQLIINLCDRKQGYTQVNMLCMRCVLLMGSVQFGGLRPFGVSFLWAGWDKNYGFQLCVCFRLWTRTLVHWYVFSYQSDPSGNYGGWKATAIGANNQAAQSILKQVNKSETANCVLTKIFRNTRMTWSLLRPSSLPSRFWTRAWIPPPSPPRNVRDSCFEDARCWPSAVEIATVSMVEGSLQYKILDGVTVDAALKELDLQPTETS